MLVRFVVELAARVVGLIRVNVPSNRSGGRKAPALLLAAVLNPASAMSSTRKGPRATLPALPICRVQFVNVVVLSGFTLELTESIRRSSVRMEREIGPDPAKVGPRFSSTVPETAT